MFTMTHRLGLSVVILVGLAIVGYNHQMPIPTTLAQNLPTPTPYPPAATDAFRLAALSYQIAQDDSYESLVRQALLATESMRRWPTQEGQVALRQHLALLPRPIISSTQPITPFIPSNAWQAVQNEAYTIHITNVISQQEVSQIKLNAPVKLMTVSPDGKWLATSKDDDRYAPVQIWDTTTGLTRTELVYPLPYGPIIIMFTPDSRYFLWAIGGSQISIFYTDGWHLFCTINDNIDRISPNSRWLTSGSVVWDITTCGKMAHLPTLFYNQIDFSQDNHYLIAQTDEITPQVFLWEMAFPSETMHLWAGQTVDKVIFSPDSHWLAKRGADNTVKLWDTQTWQLMTTITHQNTINNLVFSADSHWLATASEDKTAKIWNLSSQKIQTTLSHAGGINQIVFSPDNQMVATASDDNTARLWDLNTGRQLLRLTHDSVITGEQKNANNQWVVITQPTPINTVAFSPNGQLLATGSDDSTARLWYITLTKEITRFIHEPVPDGASDRQWKRRVYEVAFSPNGEWVMAKNIFCYTNGCGYGTRFWGMPYFEELSRSQDLSEVAVNSTGDRVALSDYKNISIQQLLPFITVTTISLSRRQDIIFSPNGKLIGTGNRNRSGDSGEAAIWDANSGERLVFMPNLGGVYKILFSYDNQYFATSSYSGGSDSINLWEVSNGRNLLHFNQELISDIDFSPNNKWLAAGNRNGYIHLFALQPADLITDACSRLPRNLSHEEWQQYVGDEPYQATCANLPIPEN